MIFGFLLLCWSGISLQADAQNSREARRSLVVATYQYADNPRIKNLEPFADHLAELLELSVSVKSYPTVLDLMRGIQQQEVDVVFMNTFGFLMLDSFSDQYEVTGALALDSTKTNQYKSVMVANKNAGIATLDEAIKFASEVTLVFVAEGSTSGNLMPRLKLASLQPGFPERFFLEVQYAGTHQLALKRAMEDRYAICAFGSDEYYQSDTTQLIKLWESPAIPMGPVLISKRVSGADREQIQRILMDLHNENQAAFLAIKAGWTEFRDCSHFETVDQQDYDEILWLSNNPEVSKTIIRYFTK